MDVASVLPKSYLEILGIVGATVDDPSRLKDLGTQNLKIILRQLRRTEEKLTQQIESQPDFRHLNLGDRDYSISISGLNGGNYPEDSLSLGIGFYQFGTTNFYRCGDCIFNRSRRYSERAECAILTAIGKEAELTPVSHCRVTNKIVEQFQAYSKKQNRASLNQLIGKRDLVRLQIKAIRKIIKSASDIPIILPSLQRDLLCYGDRVRVYMSTQADRLTVVDESISPTFKHRWVPGTVLTGAHGLTVCLDYRALTGKMRAPHSRQLNRWPEHLIYFQYESEGSCVPALPPLVLEEEYLWLRRTIEVNPDHPFLRVWLDVMGKYRLSAYNFFAQAWWGAGNTQGALLKLLTDEEVKAKPTEQRIMGAREAMFLLGFTEMPTLVQEVVDVYRRLREQAGGIASAEQGRAKDTLLLRMSPPITHME